MQLPKMITDIPGAYDKNLPIFSFRDKIVSCIRDQQVVIIAGQTGSGKTTQLPLFCLEAGRGRDKKKIGCTQPRRIAATSLAARVASQLKAPLGSVTGYKIRFSEKSSPDTVVQFMTDGILLSEIERDRLLRRYDTIIIDEAHERSLNIDFLLGYFRQLLPKRPDLKLIISSATIDTSLFSKAFSDAPVEEVSGRLFPIELLYRASEDENSSYIEEAVSTVHDLFEMQGADHTLIFMPTERDIRETCDTLEKEFSKDTDIIPLFSRLSRKEQDRIFATTDRIKIVVSTNIAESSITVPGIRYVVDTGLARISRYAPRLRTNRLPVERISRASADQRKGRCGRVKDGVCVRLYSEEDYLSRDEFTTPEIKRCNLAGVILNMKAHNLGEIETFPFLDPPAPNRITGGFTVLKELGAIDNDGNLTSIGKNMARLPFDPHISRMIIAAQKENALREVKIIAAALSIIDPRERPFDLRGEADAAHRNFLDQSSDFLSYLNIWDIFNSTWKALKTQNRMRRFCKEHFLSFVRMREWNDVYRQLHTTLTRMKGFSENKTAASYDSIHRALLTGLLSNVAYLDDNGKYSGARGREMVIFPGSVLAGKKPKWVMCHEVVETSRPYARTVATINPAWLEDLGGSLCKRSYENPCFDPDRGTVRATEKVSLFGMQLGIKRRVRYGKVNPHEAGQIFIQSGLVEEQLRSNHRFYRHNIEVREKILSTEDKLRSRTLYAGDSELYRFYSQRIPKVSSIHDLNAVIKKRGDRFLFIEESALLCDVVPEEINAYPEHTKIGEQVFPLSYSFSPGEHNDGVTLHIPSSAASFVQHYTLDWIVPGQWKNRVRDLLSCLPRNVRKQFIPLNERATEIVSILKPCAQSFNEAVAKVVKDLYNIDISSELIDKRKLSEHLIPRVEIRGKDGQVVFSGRGAECLKERPVQSCSCDSHWEEKFRSFTKCNLREWPEEDLSQVITLGSDSEGVALRGYPALRTNDDSADLVYCKSQEESDRVHRQGCKRLLEIASAKDLAWTERDLSISRELKLQCVPYGGGDQVKKIIFNMIREYALDLPAVLPRDKESFIGAANSTREKLKGTGYLALTTLEKVLQFTTEHTKKLKSMGPKIPSDLKSDLNNDILKYIEDFKSGDLRFEQYLEYPRYLSAFTLRIEKAVFSPQKYRELRGELSVFQKAHKSHLRKDLCSVKRSEVDHLGEMIEEYAISLFAQQMRTRFPVSAKRLRKRMEEIERG